MALKQYFQFVDISPAEAEALFLGYLANESINPNHESHGHLFGWASMVCRATGKTWFTVWCRNCRTWSCGRRGLPGPACKIQALAAAAIKKLQYGRCEPRTHAELASVPGGAV